MILSCQNISKSFGTDEIIKQASFHIEDYEKAAQYLDYFSLENPVRTVPESPRCLKLL